MFFDTHDKDLSAKFPIFSKVSYKAFYKLEQINVYCIWIVIVTVGNFF